MAWSGAVDQYGVSSSDGGCAIAASSGGSNLGPTSQKLNDAIKERIAAYRATNGLAADAKVPADAVTASGFAALSRVKKWGNSS